MAEESTATSEPNPEDVVYIDEGDRWLKIDNTGPVQRREYLPKSARDIGVATSLRQELEARIESEVTGPAKDAAAAAKNPAATRLPPAESDEDRAKREKAAAEAIAKADEQQAASAE